LSIEDIVIKDVSKVQNACTPISGEIASTPNTGQITTLNDDPIK